VSTKESIELIREAKARGVDVTCETAPHYLTLDDSNLCEDARFKMNPPLRSASDKKALVHGILDGTIDMIATDHAPHSDEEKARGLKDAPMGVVGLEIAFAVMYTYFVKTGILTLEKLVKLMSDSPRARFDIKSDVGFTVFDIKHEFTVNPEEFSSKGRATPFKDAKLFGECLLTVYDGQAVYISNKIK
jgi:dihydroorotase